MLPEANSPREAGGCLHVPEQPKSVVGKAQERKGKEVPEWRPDPHFTGKHFEDQWPFKGEQKAECGSAFSPGAGGVCLGVRVQHLTS